MKRSENGSWSLPHKMFELPSGDSYDAFIFKIENTNDGFSLYYEYEGIFNTMGFYTQKYSEIESKWQEPLALFSLEQMYEFLDVPYFSY